MEELLANWYSNSTAPVWSALLLGLMTAISPCPLATNITAIGFIGKDLENRNRVFISGLVYTLGRMFAYTALAGLFFLGGEKVHLSKLFQQYGEKVIGPLLIVIGIFMLGLVKLNFPAFSRFSDRFQQKSKHSFLDVFLLGVVFALAFCPYSGVLYFGMLIPLTLSSSAGMLLPPVFALATGIPVVIFAWLVAYMLSGVGKLYNGLKTFEIWFRRVVAVLFILVGIYYILQVFFGIQISQ